MAASKSEFAVHSEKTDSGLSARIWPATTAFSDNVVISYSLKDLKEHEVNPNVAMHFIQRNIGHMATLALEAGLLIRGGISVGELYHADGVVVGQALIEAYETESQVATYPRIVLAKSAMDFEEANRVKLTHVDSDGLHCLDYLTNVVLRLTPDSVVNLDMMPWITQLRMLANNEIARFTQAGDLRRLSKWRWFSERLEKTVTALSPELINVVPAKASNS